MRSLLNEGRKSILVLIDSFIGVQEVMNSLNGVWSRYKLHSKCYCTRWQFEGVTLSCGCWSKFKIGLWFFGGPTNMVPWVITPLSENHRQINDMCNACVLIVLCVVSFGINWAATRGYRCLPVSKLFCPQQRTRLTNARNGNRPPFSAEIPSIQIEGNLYRTRMRNTWIDGSEYRDRN